jgi:Mg-chelatase subunit ChlI
MADYRSSVEYGIKQRIDAAMKEEYIRSAAHIIEIVKRAMDLIDEQSPPVLESLIDYCDDLRRMDAHPKERLAVRAAFDAYCKEVLKEAREREDRLYRGITGEEPR